MKQQEQHSVTMANRPRQASLGQEADTTANSYYRFYGASRSSDEHLTTFDGIDGIDGLDGHQLLARLVPREQPPQQQEGDQENQEDAVPPAASPDTSDSQSDANYQASVTSSVRAHVYEAGLRYHAFRGGGLRGGGKLYALPNDETEQNRDDMKHALTMLLMHGQPFYAPVQDRLATGGSVYDLGTGTGIWAMEVADKYPSATVRGIDLSPIQPNYVPDNVFFAVDDFDDDWAHPPESFDFVHMRHSLFAVHDREALLQRAFRHLRPGGWVEFQELQPVLRADDGSLPDDHALTEFIDYVGRGLDTSPLLGGRFSVQNNLADDLVNELEDIGFVHATATTHKAPLGIWPRDRRLRSCGLLLRTAIMDGLRGWAQRPLGTTAGGLGWTSPQIEVFLVDVRRAVMDTNVHAYFPLHVVYAQKPEE